MKQKCIEFTICFFLTAFIMSWVEWAVWYGIESILERGIYMTLAVTIHTLVASFLFGMYQTYKEETED